MTTKIELTRPERTRTVDVDLLKAEEHDAWEAFVARHPGAGIYHTLAWRRVTEQGFGHGAYYLRAVDPAGCMRGVLPLFLVKGLFGRRLVSLPMRDRGGMVATDTPTAVALGRAAIELTRELNCRYLELRSLEPMDSAIVSDLKLSCGRNWVTTRVDLTPGRDALWKALDKDAVRYAIRKSRQQGVVIEHAENERGIDTFYELFARARRRMGIPTFSKTLFRAIGEHLFPTGQATLLIARRGDTDINAMISLSSKDAFVPAYAAPQREFSKLYPSESMIWYALEEACARGYRCFDFGADSSRQEGLLFFKRKWGGVPQRMSYYVHVSSGRAHSDFDSSSPAYGLARRVWKSMPTPLSKKIGGWVTRQLS